MKKKRINKRRVITWTLLTVFIFLPVAYYCFALWQAFGLSPVEREGVGYYESGDYADFKDGDLASMFLPAYSDLTDYESIYFIYSNSTRKTSLIRSFGSYYLVEVTYPDEFYSSKKADVLSQYNYYNEFTSPFSNDTYIKVVSAEGNDYTDYEDHYGCICYNDEMRTIYYIYWFNLPGDVDDAYYYFYRNMPIF
ncbi:MAG: hypothetical protein H6687_00795 [Bacillales bacterium]|nr:hypothetical protein [Bacillales bacterium]